MSDTPTAYARIGGEDGVRRLTQRFHALMDTVPEADACRRIHPSRLENSEQKLFEYVSGWLGGPPLFSERRGPPMLRRRHLPAKIGSAEAVGWLFCFHQAWAETVTDRELDAIILPKIDALGQHMRND